MPSDTAAALLDFYQLIKEIAAEEGISLDEAAEEAATLWPYLQEAEPVRIEIHPYWLGQTRTLAA